MNFEHFTNESYDLKILDTYRKNQSYREKIEANEHDYSSKLESIQTRLYQNRFNVNNSLNILTTQSELISLRLNLINEYSRLKVILSKLNNGLSIINAAKVFQNQTGFSDRTNMAKKVERLEKYLNVNNETKTMFIGYIGNIETYQKIVDECLFELKSIIKITDYLSVF